MGRYLGTHLDRLIKVVSNVRGPTVADTSGITVASVVINGRKSEFTEMAAIAFGRERLVGARVESYSAIAAKKHGVLHCLIGDDVYLLRTRRGRRTVVVKLNDCSDRSVCAE